MRKTHSCTTETNTQQPLMVSANSTDGLLPCFLKGDKINTVKGEIGRASCRERV